MDLDDYLSETAVYVFWAGIGLIVLILGVDHILNPGSALVANLLNGIAGMASVSLPGLLVKVVSFAAGIPVSLAGLAMFSSYAGELIS